MNIANHAAIEAFLQQQSIIRLWDDVQLSTIYHYNKAGVVPFVRKGGFSYFLMKPRSHSPELGVPTFQICKGTRQYQDGEEKWHDIRDETGQKAEVKETLAATALREGEEELGLKLDNITQLFDMGAFTFTSVTTGKTKYMWLYAAEMRSAGDFLSDAETAPSTDQRTWLSATEFAATGRHDHRHILTQIEARLTAYFKE